jgi:hypothetical protein
MQLSGADERDRRVPDPNSARAVQRRSAEVSDLNGSSRRYREPPAHEVGVGLVLVGVHLDSWHGSVSIVQR